MNSSFGKGRKSSDNLAHPPGGVNQEPSAAPSPVPAQESTKKQLIKSAGVLSLMTLTSRVLGMMRDIFTAGKFGTSWQWDSFLYAFMLPNFFRRLVGEGALSSAFIPVYSETLQKEGKKAAFHFANALCTLLGVGLMAFVLLIELGLHLLLKAGFLSDRLQLTVDLLRVFFPYLFFISLFALGMGILNCHKHFFTPALGPVILDLAWIAGVLWIVPVVSHAPADQLRWLAAILLFSGALQFAVDIPPLYKMGFRYKWVWETAHAGIKKTGKLLLPAILGFAVVQLNMLVDMICGYFAGPGANSALWYGTRLMQFPLGVFGIAISTALLPMLSHQVARQEMEAANKTLSFALRSLALILLPCTVGLIALRVPIIRLLFEHGEFDAVSTARCASVLLFYSLGLFAYAGEKIVATGFFSTQNTRMPMLMGVMSLVTDLILNIILLGPMKESGLALSTALAAMLEFSLLLYFYQKQISRLPLRRIGAAVLKILAASLAMGAVAWGSLSFFQSVFYADTVVDRLAHVFGPISVSVLSYAGFCFAFRVHEIKEAVNFVMKRKKTAA